MTDLFIESHLDSVGYNFSGKKKKKNLFEGERIDGYVYDISLSP